ncbi:MAG TPA: hypothetical protein VGE35_00965 [Candidatus Paceibacterota bacterium]
MYILKSNAEWLPGHAEHKRDGWVCKKTGADIEVETIGRSLHDGPFPGTGSGRVVQVGHLHCPGCDPNWKGPAYGTPVTPAELVSDGN